MLGGGLPLRSGVLANLRASLRYLLISGRRCCHNECKYAASSRNTPTTSTERDPLERLEALLWTRSEYGDRSVEEKAREGDEVQPGHRVPDSRS